MYDLPANTIEFRWVHILVIMFSMTVHPADVHRARLQDVLDTIRQIPVLHAVSGMSFQVEVASDVLHLVKFVT